MANINGEYNNHGTITNGTFCQQLRATLLRNLRLKWRDSRKTAAEIFLPIYTLATLIILKILIPNPNFPAIITSRGTARLFDQTNNHHFNNERNQSIAIVPHLNASHLTTHQFLDACNELWQLMGATAPIRWLIYDTADDLLSAYWRAPNDMPLAVLFHTDDPIGGQLRYEIRTNPSAIVTPATTELYSSPAACRQSQGVIGDLDQLHDTWSSVFPAIETGESCPVNQYFYSGFVELQALFDFTKIRIVSDNKDILIPQITLEMFPKEAFTGNWMVAFRLVIPIYMVMALSQFITYLLILIVGEKETHIKEGLKIMGLRDTVFWLAWFIIYAIFVTFLTIIAVILLFSLGVFQNTSFVPVFILIWLYSLSVILIGFMITPFFDNSRTAGILGSFAVNIMSLLYFIQVFINDDDNETAINTNLNGNANNNNDNYLYYSNANNINPLNNLNTNSYEPNNNMNNNYKASPILYCVSLISPTGFALAMDKILVLDIAGKGVTWQTIWSGSGISIGGSILMMAIDILLYSCIAFYLDSVIPSEHGVKRSLCFCFTKRFWFNTQKNANIKTMTMMTMKNMSTQKTGIAIDRMAYDMENEQNEQTKDDINPEIDDDDEINDVNMDVDMGNNKINNDDDDDDGQNVAGYENDVPSEFKRKRQQLLVTLNGMKNTNGGDRKSGSHIDYDIIADHVSVPLNVTAHSNHNSSSSTITSTSNSSSILSISHENSRKFQKASDRKGEMKTIKLKKLTKQEQQKNCADKSNLWHDHDSEPAQLDVEEVAEEMREHTAIRICNLFKSFNSCNRVPINAVNGINLTIYEGQITAILGHNGAGKSTLFNILTGLTSPTSGTAYIFGYDIRDAHDMQIIRRMTGVCPQHDILFDQLTPKEHLCFFAAVRGVNCKLVDDEVQKTLIDIDLIDMADVRVKYLSGGQKRKLSVGIAIIGDPKIIILDEPTAGVDPYSRRHMWSILQSRKNGKVILLTTHFMDEADILADRKAVIAQGRLRCCGSSLFLKNKFGIGYHLTLVLDGTACESAITVLVKQHVPKSERARRHGHELSYILPHDAVDYFAPLFLAIEQSINGTKTNVTPKLGITSYGVSMTTLEEVFLHLENERNDDDDDDDGNDNDNGNVITNCDSNADDDELAVNSNMKNLTHNPLATSSSLNLKTVYDCTAGDRVNDHDTESGKSVYRTRVISQSMSFKKNSMQKNLLNDSNINLNYIIPDNKNGGGTTRSLPTESHCNLIQWSSSDASDEQQQQQQQTNIANFRLTKSNASFKRSLPHHHRGTIGDKTLTPTITTKKSKQSHDEQVNVASSSSFVEKNLPATGNNNVWINLDDLMLNPTLTNTLYALLKLRTIVLGRDLQRLYLMIILPLGFTAIGLYLNSIQIIAPTIRSLVLDNTTYGAQGTRLAVHIADELAINNNNKLNLFIDELNEMATVNYKTSKLNSQNQNQNNNNINNNNNNNNMQSTLNESATFDGKFKTLLDIGAHMGAYNLTDFDWPTNNIVITVFYNDTVQHGLPIVLNILSNTFLRMAARNLMDSKDNENGDNDAFNTFQSAFQPIEVRAHPFQQTVKPQEFNIGTFSSALFVGMIFVLIPVSLAIDIVYDREMRAKNQLYVSGLSKTLYFASYGIILTVLMVFICCALLGLVYIFDIPSFRQTPALITLALIIGLYSPAAILCATCFSYLFDRTDSAQSILPNVLTFIGLIPFIIVIFLDMMGVDTKAAIILHYIFSLINPMYIPYAAVYFVDRVYVACRLSSACAELTMYNYITEEMIIMMVGCLLHLPIWLLCLYIIDNHKTNNLNGRNLVEMMRWMCTSSNNKTNVVQKKRSNTRSALQKKKKCDNRYRQQQQQQQQQQNILPETELNAAVVATPELERTNSSSGGDDDLKRNGLKIMKRNTMKLTSKQKTVVTATAIAATSSSPQSTATSIRITSDHNDDDEQSTELSVAKHNYDVGNQQAAAAAAAVVAQPPTGEYEDADVKLERAKVDRLCSLHEQRLLYRNNDDEDEENDDDDDENDNEKQLEENNESNYNYNINAVNTDNTVVIVQNLRKEFNRSQSGQFFKSCCCCVKKSKSTSQLSQSYPSTKDDDMHTINNTTKTGTNAASGVRVAVKCLSLAVDAGEVVGLLGHNGAGKTTTMKIMTGETQPTCGAVKIAGHNIDSARDAAFRKLGYCPQHDALWKTVTVREHLEVYASIRGIKPNEQSHVINAYLKALQLCEHANKQTQHCSGGTRRKLSYAIAMIGQPKVVLLDEPSTGMDPKSKRFLWDTILSSFRYGSRGAILTTHSMEEADALCTRVGIMVKGELRCLGSTQHLKNLYGAGYTLEIKLQHNYDVKSQQRKTNRSGGDNEAIRFLSNVDRMKACRLFVNNTFPDALLEESFADRLVYSVPQQAVNSLAECFRSLERAKSELGIEEYSFSQTTLEQVFLKFAHYEEEAGSNCVVSGPNTGGPAAGVIPNVTMAAVT